MRVGVVGSRGYKPLSDVEELVRSFPPGTVVVSGTAPHKTRPELDRVDERAIRTAEACGLAVKVHRAKWRGEDGRGPYWPGAGLHRNTLIARDIHRLVAFYDGESTGTMDTITKARRMGIPVEVREMKR